MSSDQLPAVTEIIRWHYQPGDRLIVRTDALQLDDEDAHLVREQVRHALKLPADIPVAIVSGHWQVSVIERRNEPAAADTMNCPNCGQCLWTGPCSLPHLSFGWPQAAETLQHFRQLDTDEITTRARWADRLAVALESVLSPVTPPGKDT